MHGFAGVRGKPGAKDQPQAAGGLVRLRFKLQVGDALLELLITPEDVTITYLQGTGKVQMEIGPQAFQLGPETGSLQVAYPG